MIRLVQIVCVFVFVALCLACIRVYGLAVGKDAAVRRRIEFEIGGEWRLADMHQTGRLDPRQFVKNIIVEHGFQKVHQVVLEPDRPERQIHAFPQPARRRPVLCKASAFNGRGWWGVGRAEHEARQRHERCQQEIEIGVEIVQVAFHLPGAAVGLRFDGQNAVGCSVVIVPVEEDKANPNVLAVLATKVAALPLETNDLIWQVDRFTCIERQRLTLKDRLAHRNDRIAQHIRVQQQPALLWLFRDRPAPIAGHYPDFLGARGISSFMSSIASQLPVPARCTIQVHACSILSNPIPLPPSRLHKLRLRSSIKASLAFS